MSSISSSERFIQTFRELMNRQTAKADKPPSQDEKQQPVCFLAMYTAKAVS